MEPTKIFEFDTEVEMLAFRAGMDAAMASTSDGMDIVTYGPHPDTGKYVIEFHEFMDADYEPGGKFYDPALDQQEQL